MVHSSKQERVAWEAKFEAQIEAEIKKIAVLEQQIAQLATALSPQSAEEPDVPVPKKSLSDLILELDPDLFWEGRDKIYVFNTSNETQNNKNLMFERQASEIFFILETKKIRHSFPL